MVRHSPLDASVIVPARNSESVIGTQLAALATQDFGGRWEVLVADNGSTDGTAALVASAAARFPAPLRLVDASRRRGANAARNHGVRATTGDAVLFCDHDDQVGPGWVRALVDALDTAHTAGGPLGFTALNVPEHRGRGFEIASSVQVYCGFRYSLSSNLGVRREAFDRIGGFDERYLHGFDDVDLGYRAHLTQLTLVEAPGAHVEYRLRSTRRALVRQQYGYGTGSRMFHEKFPEVEVPTGRRAAGGLVAVAAQGLRLPVDAMRSRRHLDRRLSQLAYQLGALRGASGEPGRPHAPGA